MSVRAKSLTVFGIAWLAVMRAGAEEAPRIAVIHDAAADERTIARLRGELSTLGLRVVEVPLAPSEGASSLDDAARRVDAFAAVRVVPAQSGVEVWVADRVTGKTLLRELVVGPGDAADDIVALQAVELLRASLAELGLSTTRHGDVAPSAAVRKIAPVPAPPSPPEHRLTIQIGPAMTLSPGGFGTTGSGFVGVRFRAVRTFGVGAWTLLPILSASVDRPEGGANLSPLAAGADVAWWILEPPRPWQLSVAGGVAGVRLGIDGHANPPRTGKSDPVTVALPFGRLSLRRSLGQRYGLGLDAFVGVAAPAPVVRFEGRQVAHWGRPMTALALSFDAALD